MKPRFTARALGDLQRLRAFIAENNPQAASRIGGVLRRWVAGPYVVHYTIDGNALTVLRIWHGREQRSES